MSDILFQRCCNFSYACASDIAFYSAFDNRACAVFFHHIQYQFKQQTDRYPSFNRRDEKRHCKDICAETIIIALIALIVSYVMDVVLTIYINNMYAASLAENPFDIIIPNIAICLIIPLITVALTLVSSVIPIRMMSKKRTVEIIHSSE